MGSRLPGESAVNDLTGKRALVCGASRGIGRACAAELAGRGAAVTIAARDAEALAKAVGELPGSGHASIAADLGDPEAARDRFEAHLASWGSVEILVNNSGGPPPGPVREATAEALRAAFAQHLLANQILAGLVVPGMVEAGYGRIVNIISTSVKEPIAGLGVSNTIRGAVASWAKTLAREVAPHGVTVNNVLPGATFTERLDSLLEAWADRDGLSRSEFEARFLLKIPAGRFARPEEIAAAVGFLASPAAGYVNGINLPVDGGRTSCL